MSAKTTFVNNKIAAILNRKMKAAGYETTVSKLKGRYGMNIINDFGGMNVEHQREIEQMVLDATQAAYPDERINF